MKNLLLVLSFGLICLGSFAQNTNQTLKVTEIIKTVYIDGIQNCGGLDVVEAGCHKNFVMNREIGGKLKQSNLDQILMMMKKGKQAKIKIDPIQAKVEEVIIHGKKALVSVDLYRNEKIIGQDLISLYQFADGWKLINKI